MKALEILKSIKPRLFYDYEVWGGYREASFDEAIAELEALQAHKTCDGCKYDNPHWFNEYCGHCEREKYCDYYEPKETK